MAHLVFQTAFPGDLFLSIPLLRRLRAWEPENEIVLACRPRLGEFFVHHRLVDRVIEIDKRTREGRARAAQLLANELWDHIFVPHESPRTALMIWRLRSRRGKVGFRRWWNSIVFQRRVERPMALPDGLRQLSLLAAVDATTAELLATPSVQGLRNSTSRSSPLPLSTPIPDWASMRLREPTPRGRQVFLAPGSVWATKRWTEEGFTDLAQQLKARGYEVALVGSKAEKDLCDRIASQVSGLSNHAGRTTLTELVGLLKDGTALVSNDSGAMHAAAVVGLPTVAIFGPTTLELGYRPWNEKTVIVQKDLKCRPCGKHGAETCPIRTHACMREISVGEVLAALEFAIAGRST